MRPSHTSARAPGPPACLPADPGSPSALGSQWLPEWPSWSPLPSPGHLKTTALFKSVVSRPQGEGERGPGQGGVRRKWSRMVGPGVSGEWPGAGRLGEFGPGPEILICQGRTLGAQIPGCPTDPWVGQGLPEPKVAPRGSSDWSKGPSPSSPPFPGGAASGLSSPHVPFSSPQLAITDWNREEDVLIGEAQGFGEVDEVLLQLRGQLLGPPCGQMASEWPANTP